MRSSREKGKTMFEKTMNGTEIITKATNTANGYEVFLTRRTTKSGNIRHGVVIKPHMGRYTRLKSFLGIAPAFNLYKNMLNA